jgi:hypothetical protein
VIRQILRHANVTTTMNIYVKTVSVDAANAMVQRFRKRVIALWLAGKLLKTQDAVRLALDGLGKVGNLLG